MKIIEVLKEARTESLIKNLTKIWEESVRVTHLFLSEKEIKEIKGYVPDALKNVEHLIIVESGSVFIGFMGIENRRLEMLFLSPEECGKGLGKELLALGISQYDVQELTVNEQNPNAIGFYEHMGFKRYKRTDLDEQENPYPLLYMRL